MKTIQEFQVDNKECEHFNLVKNIEKYDDLSIDFCTKCGTIIFERWQQMGDKKMTFYVTPYDAWKLFNYKFGIMS